MLQQLPVSHRRPTQEEKVFAAAALTVAVGVFVVDFATHMRGAVAVLYFAVPLLMAHACGRSAVLLSALGCAILAVVTYLVNQWHQPLDGSLVRLGVTLVALAAATALSIRDRSVRLMLAEQARALELTHDTVIIRDASNIIRYWNDGAEHLYGYSRDEAIGAHCSDLLHCRYVEDAVFDALKATGSWSGDMRRTRRNGDRIDLTSRWLQLRDPRGHMIGIMETSADVTEQRRSHIERDHIEMRYTAIFQAAGFATWESDWSAVHAYIMEQTQDVEGDLRSWLRSRPDVLRKAAKRAVIQEANHAAVLLFEAENAEELIGTSIVGDYVDGGEDGFVAILAGLAEGAEVVEADTRLSTQSGREIDVVLRATLVPDGVPWSRALVMAFDETERKEARARIEKASADLAHAARVSTLGQLTASIAHEVNQPLSAIVTYAKSGQRWLTLETPDIPEALACFVRVVANGSRASEVIGRVRSQARNTPPQPERIALATIAYDAVALVEREIRAARVTVRTMIPANLPEATGDRVQTQQVLVNLILNAAQAMATSDAADREIRLAMEAAGDGFVRVSVEDRGCGIALDDPMTIFAPFFTTKKEGMGMGLSICKSIIEAQGGRIRARNNEVAGATISFTLPVAGTSAMENELAHTSI